MKRAAKRPDPPRLAAWGLGKLLPYDPKKAYLDDIEEVYLAISAERGPLRAHIWYWMQLLLALPPSLNNIWYWGMHMLTHYIKTAARSFRKNKAVSFINVVGLSFAVGCAVVLFLFIDLQVNMDAFHEHADAIYLVESVIESSGEVQTWGHSPVPLGPALQQAAPQVERVVRMDRSQAAMRYEALIFNETVSFVDPAFFDMFTFPLQYGNTEALADQNSLILSAQIAEKYFGDANPVGEQVTLTFNDKQVESFTIQGVAEKVPHNASFGFNVLVTYAKQQELGHDLSDWGSLTAATFVQLEPSADIKTLESHAASYIELQQIATPDRPIARFLLDPLRQVPTRALNLRESPLAMIHPVTAWFSGIMALMILSISCFNYVNFAIVAATRRAKEIGIRKVVGSYKWQLVVQFMGENLVLGFIALVLGVILTATLFIPGLNTMIDGAGFALNITENGDLWIFLALVLTVTAIGAGLYPALYISGFQPVKVLKGIQTIRGKNRLTRVLLTVQFVVSFVLLAFAIATIQSANAQRSRDWGYHQQQTLVIPFKDASQYVALKNEIAHYPHILNQAGAADHIGQGGRNAVVKINGQPAEVKRFDVGFTYLEVMKLRLKEGRFFDEQLQSDVASSVLVNETFIQEVLKKDELFTETALGQAVHFGGQPVEIIGVVEDFHYEPFLFKVEPVVLRVVDEAALRYLAVDVQPGMVAKTSDYLKATWSRLIPDIPYEGFFQDGIFDSYFRGMDRGATIFLFIGGVALFIAMMGLFGLVPLTIAKRMKEISIRKVMGASLWDVVKLIQKDLVIVLVLAVAFGGVISFFATNALLSVMMADAWTPGGWTFVLPAGLILGIAFAASFVGIYRGATVNPIDVLRRGSE